MYSFFSLIPKLKLKLCPCACLYEKTSNAVCTPFFFYIYSTAARHCVLLYTSPTISYTVTTWPKSATSHTSLSCQLEASSAAQRDQKNWKIKYLQTPPRGQKNMKSCNMLYSCNDLGGISKKFLHSSHNMDKIVLTLLWFMPK